MYENGDAQGGVVASWASERRASDAGMADAGAYYTTSSQPSLAATCAACPAGQAHEDAHQRQNGSDQGLTATGLSGGLISHNTLFSPTPWPQLDEAAYYGLAGEIVHTIEPHTESDPVALLVQQLVMVGNLIGRVPYFPVEADRPPHSL